MAKRQTLVSDYEAKLDRKERELLLRKNAVLAFVDTTHSAGDVKKLLKKVRETEIKLNLIMRDIIKFKASAEFSYASEKLCTRCRELTHYTKDMHQILSDNLAECQRIEGGKIIDYIKNITFLITLPAAIFTAVKNGLGDGIMSPNQAAGASAAFSIAVLFRKTIAETCKKSGKAICEIPQHIKNDPALLYLRETAKENAAAIKTAFKETAQVMKTSISRNASRVKNVTAKLGKNREP